MMSNHNEDRLLQELNDRALRNNRAHLANAERELERCRVEAPASVEPMERTVAELRERVTRLENAK